MPQFRPNLPVFRPTSSLQSSPYAGESNGTSTPTYSRPTMPSFPRMPQFASPSLSTSASHPTLPTGMSQNDYQISTPTAPSSMQNRYGQVEQGQLPNSHSQPSQLNYFHQNTPQQADSASFNQQYHTSSAQPEPQHLSYNSNNNFTQGMKVENALSNSQQIKQPSIKWRIISNQSMVNLYIHK